MRFTSRITLVACILCLTLPAFGQDLTFYTKMGKLVPHVPGTGKGDRDSLLIYKNRGMMFHMFRGRSVLSVTVFRPEMPVPSAVYPGGTDVLVPGVGACGVTLGMSKDQVKASPYLRHSRKRIEDASSAFYDIGHNTKLLVLFSAGNVSQLQVFGPFTTASGITDISTDIQIEGVYGTPDEYYEFEMRKGLSWALSAVLIPPVLGLVTGLAIRSIRPRAEDASRRLVRLAALGAIGLAIAAVLAGMGFSVLSGMGNDWQTMWYNVAGAVLTGAGSVLALELLSRPLSGCLGAMITLVIMLFVAYISNMVVGVVSPAGQVVPPLARLAVFNGPFVVAMFLGAGMKRPGTHRVHQLDRRDMDLRV